MKKITYSLLIISLFGFSSIAQALSFRADDYTEKSQECTSHGGIVSSRPDYGPSGNYLWETPICSFNDGTTCDLLSSPQCRPNGSMARPSFCTSSEFTKLTRGSRGIWVRELQQFLAIHGYNPGVIDEVYGRQVVASVKEFQNAYQLLPDGVFGKKTKYRLCTLPYFYQETPTYSVTTTRSVDLTGPVGGSVSYKDIKITTTGLSATKYSNIEIEHDVFAIVPNPVHTKESRLISTNLTNGDTLIENVLIGPILSITINGVTVPFQEIY